MKLRRKLPGGFVLALLALTAHAEDIATGTVFEDLNGNSRLDAGEPGIPGVRVSDGETVRLTDESGRYRFRIDDGPEQPMRRVRRPDPYMVENFIRNADTKKSWLRAAPSSHLFSADLPDDLAAGTYTLSVRAIDEFGGTHHAHSILEITGS